MHLSRVLSTLCAAAIATGCAGQIKEQPQQLGQNQSSAPAAELALRAGIEPDFMKMTVNAPPGKFQEYLTSIRIPQGGADTSTVSVRFLKLRASETWAPTIALCLQGDDSSHERACLTLGVMRDGTVTASKFERNSVNRDAPSRQRLPDTFKSDATLKVRVVAKVGQSSFFVGDELAFESTVVSKPIRFAFSCASAVCEFDVLP